VASRVALVTGASRGLGRIIALDLAAHGWTVGVHGRDTSAVAAVAAEIEAAGGRAGRFTADLGDPSSGPAHLHAEVAAHLGPVDLLVNNAADQTLAPLAEASVEYWMRMMAVDLVSAVELTRLVVAAHPDRSRLSVVNVASVEALVPFPNHAAYAAAKAALLSFTAAAAVEYAPARVNAVAPGLVERDGLAQAWPDGYAWWCSTSPAGRPVHAHEVADAVRLLAESTGVSGTNLPVDGGWSASARQI
jgi:3-oxoacyl-[acyl-carrier protein] reductase